MNRLTFYILRQTLVVMLSVCIALTLAVWLIQSLRLIDLIVNRGLSIGLFVYLALLILPRFLEVVLPIAAFVAVLFVYNKLTTESELIVMRASGMSQRALARPALLSGLIAMAILYALSLFIVPAANRTFKDLQFEIRNKFGSALIQDGVFNTLSDRLMVYVSGRNSADELLSLLIYDMRDPGKPVTIFAERGAFVDTPDGPRILMVNGTRQQRDQSDGHLSVLTFEKYTLDLADLNDAAGGRERQPDERHTGELISPRGDISAGTARAFFIELNMRLAGPLGALAMAVLPILCLLPGEYNRRGQSRRVLGAMGLGMALQFVDVGLKDAAGRSDVAVLLIYVNLMLPLAALAVLQWRDRQGANLTRLVARTAS